MGVELQRSGLAREVDRILKAPGSPYFRLEVLVHVGGKDLRPHQILRLDEGCDFRADYCDTLALTVVFGSGTLMLDIAPYQDDIQVTINLTPLNETGNVITTSAVLSTTYRAYLADDIERAVESTGDPTRQSKEVGNLARLRQVTFQLEELAVEQLRKMSFGFVARSAPPYMVMKTLLTQAANTIRLPIEQNILGFDMEQANNQEPRNHIVIPDGTPLLDIPDLLQNEQGGVYSTGLGFYIRQRRIYSWPLYDIARQSSARRLLQIFLSPTKFAAMVDRTWENHGRELAVFAAGVSKIIDDSLGKLNNQGNAVRYTDARQLLGGMGEVKNNKFIQSRTQGNSEFSVATVGNGQNHARVSDRKVTSNIYLESSKIARNNGVFLTIPWRRSNPSLIVPGMAAVVHYDYGGLIRTLEGTLVGAYSTYALEGTGLAANTHRTTTSLVVFIDRNDPDYIDYLKAGGTISPVPDIGSL